MKLKGRCHCGSTQFSVERAPETVTQCTCSICSKRGALWAYYSPSEVTFEAKPEPLSTYRWQSMTVALNFCSTCGCSTFNESPDWSTGTPDFDNPRLGLNARLFEDFDVSAVPVTHIDGKNLW